MKEIFRDRHSSSSLLDKDSVDAIEQQVCLWNLYHVPFLPLISSLDFSFFLYLTWLHLVIVANAEHSSSDWYMRTNQNVLGHANYVILFALDCCVVQMISRHFETGFV